MENHDNEPVERTAFEELLETIKKLGDPPCKGCPKFRHCASEPAACGDYAAWVEDNEVRNLNRFPSRDLFDFVFGNEPFPIKLPPNTRNRVLAALIVEARDLRVPSSDLQRTLQQESGIADYGRFMRVRGVGIAGASMAVLLNRWPGQKRTIRELDNILARKT